MFGLRAALPVLAETGGGSVVVTSSLAGIAPHPFDPIYSATKHAIIGLVRSVAPVCAEFSVTLNAVCPGFIDTPLLAPIRDEVVKHGLAIADPDEVASAVESIVAGGQTGQAWIVQASQPPTPVEFPPIRLTRADQ